MNVLKTFTTSSGNKLELIEIGTDKFEIHLNNKVEATESDWTVACETFDNLVQYYS